MEKLTNGTTVTVRFTEQGHSDLRALADAEGMEVSDYVRHLVALDREQKRNKWAALDRVFSKCEGGATNTRKDDV